MSLTLLSEGKAARFGLFGGENVMAKVSGEVLWGIRPIKLVLSRCMTTSADYVKSFRDNSGSYVLRTCTKVCKGAARVDLVYIRLFVIIHPPFSQKAVLHHDSAASTTIECRYRIVARPNDCSIRSA